MVAPRNMLCLRQTFYWLKILTEWNTPLRIYRGGSVIWADIFLFSYPWIGGLRHKIEFNENKILVFICYKMTNSAAVKK